MRNALIGYGGSRFGSIPKHLGDKELNSHKVKYSSRALEIVCNIGIKRDSTLILMLVTVTVVLIELITAQHNFSVVSVLCTVNIFIFKG